MRPSLEELIDDLTNIRTEQAIDEALIMFSNPSTLQILVDVTEKMQEALKNQDWDSVPNLKEEADSFMEMHAHDIYELPQLYKALLTMQIKVNQEVIAYVRKAYQEAHNISYFSDHIDQVNNLLKDDDVC